MAPRLLLRLKVAASSLWWCVLVIDLLSSVPVNRTAPPVLQVLRALPAGADDHVADAEQCRVEEQAV